MTDFQTPGQNWSEKNPVIGAGEGEVPLANTPIAEVAMRTMSSDIASIKETGGGEPKPYNPTGNIPAPSSVIPPQTDFGNANPASAIPEMQMPKSKTNWFMLLAVLVGVGALIALGYFFIYPRFFAVAPVIAPVTEQPPVVNQEVPPPELPIEATSTITESPFETVVMHTSLFKTSADTISEATLASVTLDAVKSAIQSNTVDVPLLKEIVFKNSVGKTYALSAIAPLFVPSVFTSSTMLLFQPDASFFTYVDKTGAWPGMVLKLASGADVVTAQTEIKKLETNNEFASMFLANPGTAGRWKDGKVSTFIARYISYSTKNVAFSYAWLNDNLVISTSYAGAQAAAVKLGL
ncbi:MAG: hypothetical protein AAB920_02680 [Patescibacteria group bacterium]